MEYRPLGNTDMNVSILSLGASSLGSVFRPTSLEESINVVHCAITEGINYIDTAPWYGHGKSEKVLGKALENIDRSKYYIATKVGRYEPDIKKMFDFSAERTLRSADESLSRLGLDYVDVIQVHDMEFAEDLSIIWKESLPALHKIKESGKARYIGITGYPLENFKKVLDNSTVHVDVILTYCHYSMNDTSLESYIPYFQDKGVGIVNASPISMGLLSNRGPPDWHPAPPNVRNTCKEASKYCKNIGFDVSRLAIDFTLNERRISTTLVSTASVDNLKANIEVAKRKLSPKEKQVQQECYDTYFAANGNLSWEGIEVENYFKEISNIII